MNRHHENGYLDDAIREREANVGLQQLGIEGMYYKAINVLINIVAYHGAKKKDLANSYYLSHIFNKRNIKMFLI